MRRQHQQPPLDRCTRYFSDTQPKLCPSAYGLFETLNLRNRRLRVCSPTCFCSGASSPGHCGAATGLRRDKFVRS